MLKSEHFETVHLKCTPGSSYFRFLNTPSLLIMGVWENTLSNEGKLTIHAHPLA